MVSRGRGSNRPGLRPMKTQAPEPDESKGNKDGNPPKIPLDKSIKVCYNVSTTNRKELIKNVRIYLLYSRMAGLDFCWHRLRSLCHYDVSVNPDYCCNDP